MTWVQLSATNVVDLDQVYLVTVTGDDPAWSVNLLLSGTAIDARNTTTYLLTMPTTYSTKAEAESAAEELVGSAGGKWLYSAANADQWYNAEFVSEFVTDGDFVVAWLLNGVAPSSGYSPSPAITQYSSSAAAEAGLAQLLMQLTIVNAGD